MSKEIVIKSFDLPEVPETKKQDEAKVTKPRIHISDNNCVSCEG